MHENATVHDGGEFDPRAAAALLEQTTSRARRQFEFPSLLLMVVQAAALLAAYGAIWLSVRGQNPYSGPSGAAWWRCTHSWPSRRSRSVWTPGARPPGSAGSLRGSGGFGPSP